MPNYTYKETVADDSSWIEKLEHIDPLGAQSANFADIHFTKPKLAVVSTLSHPHVTFVLTDNSKCHWYVQNQNGAWTVISPSKTPLVGQQEIADKVLKDAVALNWIRAAPPPKLIDTDGFTTVESKYGKKARMQTGF